MWSLKSNYVDVPTDCPQREKSGWDGDAQVFLPTASYMADTAAFFRKWLRDLRDCQRKDGRVANVSPSVHRFQDRESLSGAAGWAFLYNTVSGIRIDTERHFKIAPQPGGTLTHAAASWCSPIGKVESSWKLSGSAFTLDVNIPCNTTAMVVLPNGTAEKVNSGHYTFRCEI